MRIALQWIRDYYRDGSALFFGLIFPIVMTACLGSLLSGLDNPDDTIYEMKIAYVVEAPEQAGEDANEAGSADESAGATTVTADTAQAVAAFTDALDDAGYFDVTEADSAAAARKDIETDKLDAALVFDKDLNVTVIEGGDVTINRAAHMIASGFARRSSAYLASYEVLAQDDPAYIAVFSRTAEDAARSAADYLKDRDFGGRTQSMMDFYAVTMIIMICFMGGGIGGASGIYMSRREGLMRRLTVSPKSGSAIFLESVLGMVPGNIAQTLMVMVPATLFLGAHYAQSMADNLLLFAFFVLLGTAATALFMVIGLVLKSNPYIPLMVILWTALFISGSFQKNLSIPGVSELMPMNIANRAAFDLTMFGRTDGVLTVMAVCAAILAASCVVGSLALDKRKEIAL
jgi:ABC-2 type transport system permease protein